MVFVVPTLRAYCYVTIGGLSHGPRNHAAQTSGTTTGTWLRAYRITILSVAYSKGWKVTQPGPGSLRRDARYWPITCLPLADHWLTRGPSPWNLTQLSVAGALSYASKFCNDPGWGGWTLFRATSLSMACHLQPHSDTIILDYASSCIVTWGCDSALISHPS